MKETYQDFLDRLKEERLRLGLSQDEMGRLLRMTQSHYSKAEHGAKRFTYYETQCICDTDVDVYQTYTLIGNTGNSVRGTLNVNGKIRGTKDDTVLYDVINADNKYSMFEVINPNTALNINNDQIQNAVNLFINNFLTAVRPQVIKHYAQGNPDEMYRLTFQSARFSFYLMLVLVLPICFELRFILDIWLGDAYPPDTYIFTLIVLIFSLSEVFHLVLIMPFHAIGKMKLRNSLNGTIMIMALPISYFVLHYGYPDYSVSIVLIVINLIVTFNGWIIIYSYSKFSIRNFLTNVLLRCQLVCPLSIVTPFVIICNMHAGWIRLITLCILSFISTIVISFFLGMESEERKLVSNFVRRKIIKNHEK